jgi:hypothetical protein
MEVMVINKIRDTILTTAFRNPTSLQNATNIFASYKDFSIGPQKDVYACMIGLEANKAGIFLVVVTALLMSLVGAILVGCLSGHIEVGCAFGGSLIALVAALQMALLCVLK